MITIKMILLEYFAATFSTKRLLENLMSRHPNTSTIGKKSYMFDFFMPQNISQARSRLIMDANVNTTLEVY